MRDPFVLRDKAAVERFMDGLDVMEPGLVTVDQWTPHGKVRDVDGPATPFYAAVAHKVTEQAGPPRAQPKAATVATTRLHRDAAVGVAR
jgi:hypothetical protein